MIFKSLDQPPIPTHVHNACSQISVAANGSSVKVSIAKDYHDITFKHYYLTLIFRDNSAKIT